MPFYKRVVLLRVYYYNIIIHTLVELWVGVLVQSLTPPCTTYHLSRRCRRGRHASVLFVTRTARNFYMYNKLRTADNICPGYLQLLLLLFFTRHRHNEILTCLPRDRLRSDSQTTRTDDDNSTASRPDYVQLGIGRASLAHQNRSVMYIII